MKEKQLTKAEKLAEEVLVLSRNTLLVNLRFLDAALSQFEMKPVGESSMLTDGHFLLYNPKHVLSNFKHQKETVVPVITAFGRNISTGWQSLCSPPVSPKLIVVYLIIIVTNAALIPTILRKQI